ncbi:hypothetical protein Bca101_013301 [Brassica carinata]
MGEPSPESSPTAPIRALVALSSPIRQIQNPDESAECNDSEILPRGAGYSSVYGDLLYNRRPSRWNFDFSSDDDDDDDDLTVDIFSWSSPENKPPTGVGAGLNNSGNTCFIASVLQCLTHTVPLLHTLASYKFHYPCNFDFLIELWFDVNGLVVVAIVFQSSDCGNENFCVLMALRNHIDHALRSSGYDIKIDRFRDNLNFFSSNFQINHQEDAHEFLQSVLDKLDKCCLEPGSRDNNPASVSSQDVNIVHHVFGGRLVSKLRCCNCNSVSETFETSLGWSLEIEDVEDLSSALESFTCVEELEDQFTCDDCKEKVSKEKQLKFDKLPLVATFHLKRFKNNGVYMQKIFKDVSTKYHLYAMVEHLGRGTHFGHYTACVRSAPETWHHFDDAKVRRISEECVLSKDAYILFYAREGTPCFASAFEEMKTLFDDTPMNFSPKSVLETATYSKSESCSDHHCDEPRDEVFHSAESNSVDEFFAFESPNADDFEKPFAETFHQEERPLYPDGNSVTINEASVTVLKIQEQVSSPKRKTDERAMIGEETFLTKRKLQKPNTFSKRQGPFQIRREQLRNKKKREETCRTNPYRSIVAAAADPKEKKHAVSYLMSRPQSSRFRMLVAALGVNVKRKKVSNIRRSKLYRNLSDGNQNESLG